MGKENLISEKANNPWTKVPGDTKQENDRQSKQRQKTNKNAHKGTRKKSESDGASNMQDAYLD